MLKAIVVGFQLLLLVLSSANRGYLSDDQHIRWCALVAFQAAMAWFCAMYDPANKEPKQ